MKNGKRILKIELKRMVDESPDTSWMGEFSNRADTQFAIDHQERSGSSRVKQWFNPGTVEDFDPNASWYPSHSPSCNVTLGCERGEICCCHGMTDAEKREYWHQAMTKNAEQDYARMCSLCAGEFEFIGIGAKAEVVVNNTCQMVTSGGLWGIESDSGEDYLREEEQNQLAELRTILCEMGFSKRSIATAIKEMRT